MVDISPGLPEDNRNKTKIRRLKEDQLRKRARRGDPLIVLPEASKKLKEVGLGVIKDTEKFFTKTGERIIDTALSRPDGPALRELMSSEEERWREFEKYAEGLKQSQIEWQKEAGNLIHDILKLGDNAAELYEAFQEYPFSDNYKDYGKDKEDAANKRDHRISLINQAIALYYRNTLQDLDKLRITNRPEFKDMQHFTNTLKAKMSDRADMDRAAAECEIQSKLAQSQIAHSQKRDREGRAHSKFIQGLPDGIGRATKLRRLLKGGYVKRYSEQAEKRAAELENFLADVDRHQQDTAAKIEAYRSQAQKRFDVLQDLLARRITVNRIIRSSRIKDNLARIRAQDATTRVGGDPIGSTRYKNIVDGVTGVPPTLIPTFANNLAAAQQLEVAMENAALAVAACNVASAAVTADEGTAAAAALIANDATAIAASPLATAVVASRAANTEQINRAAITINTNTAARNAANTARATIGGAITTSFTEAEQAGRRAQSARTRAAEAETRAQSARTRAAEAETRARIAIAYDYHNISDIAFKNAAIYASEIENLEKELAKNAYLSEIYARNEENALATIEYNFTTIDNIVEKFQGGMFALQDIQKVTDKIVECTKNIEEAEIAKNSAIALEEKAVLAEQAIRAKITEELEKEYAALGQESTPLLRIQQQAARDLTTLQNLERRQKELQDTLRGRAATPTRAALPSLIELEKNQSRAAKRIAKAIIEDRVANLTNVGIGGADLKAEEERCRQAIGGIAAAPGVAAIEGQRARFERALARVMEAEEGAAGVLKRNAIHMAQDVMSDANQATECLQKIKDNLADQDDEGLKNRPKGHLFIDPKVGKWTLGDEGVWMHVREVDGWEPLDPARPGQTTVRFRPDIVKIEIETITRESGKTSVEPIYTKRLSERFHQSDNYQYTLEVPGNSFADKIRRRYATLEIVNLKKRDGTIAKPLAMQAKAAAKAAAAATFVRGNIPKAAALAAATAIVDGLVDGLVDDGTVANAAIDAAATRAEDTILSGVDPTFSSLARVIHTGGRGGDAAQAAHREAVNAAKAANATTAQIADLDRRMVGIAAANVVDNAITAAIDAKAAVYAAGGAATAASIIAQRLGGAAAANDATNSAYISAIGGQVGTTAINGAFVDETTAINALAAAAVWSEDEYTETRIIAMEAAGTIRIRENHNNQSTPAEVLFITDVETMPSPVINHAKALARRQGEGWTDEQKRHMWKLDLDRRVLSHPNGQEYSMDEFDWSETKWDEVNGLTLQYKGPRELSQVNLLTAGSYDKFSEKLAETAKALKMKKRKHLADGIEWMKQSIRSLEENKINAVIGSIQSHEGIEAYQSHMMKNELESPPKNRLDLEKLREKKKAEKKALTPKWMAHYTESTAKMIEARRGYEDEVKECIQAIHEKDPLSALDVLKSLVNPEKYPLTKHRSSKKKQELRNEIRAANHLDKIVHFQLLEDPKRGPAGPAVPGRPASLVKNLAPNGLELLREYNLYKNQQDFANQIERQNVEDYVASIETLFTTNLIDPYYTNQWYLEQAMTAANDGKFLGKVVNGTYIPGASDYIRNLKQMDRPLIIDSIASKRQNDEHEWVTYLLDGLGEAKREGMEELLAQAIPIAKSMQESKFSNLERAEKALYLDTSSDDAKKILDDIDLLPLPGIEEKTKAEEKAKVDTTKDKNQFDSKEITKRSDKELGQAAVEVAGDQYQQVVNQMESLLASVSDPILQKKYREASVQMTSELYKDAQEIFKLAFAKRERLEALELWDKKEQEWWRRDLIEKLAFMWLQQGINTGNKGLKDAEAEFMKLLKKIMAV